MKRGILLFGISILILTGRYYFSVKTLPLSGTRIRLTATVLTEPVYYPESQRLKFGALSTYLPAYPLIEYGDWVTIEGQVQDREVKKPKLVKLTKSENALFSLRKSLINNFKKTLPEPHSSLLAGVVMGSKADMPKSFWEKLKATGTAHIVVASGTNISNLSNFLLGIFVVIMNRRRAVYFTLALVAVYCILIGLEAPIIRAFIMSAFLFLGWLTGRQYQAFQALVICMFVMLFVNPLWITDVGFLLSFASTGSLILFASFVDRKLYFVPLILRGGLSTSLAAQVGTLPIMLVVFGRVNILSPIINALILWTIPFISLIGSIGAFIPIVNYLAYPFTFWFTTIINLF